MRLASLETDAVPPKLMLLPAVLAGAALLMAAATRVTAQEAPRPQPRRNRLRRRADFRLRAVSQGRVLHVPAGAVQRAGRDDHHRAVLRLTSQQRGPARIFCRGCAESSAMCARTASGNRILPPQRFADLPAWSSRGSSDMPRGLHGRGKSDRRRRRERGTQAPPQHAVPLCPGKRRDAARADRNDLRHDQGVPASPPPAAWAASISSPPASTKRWSTLSAGWRSRSS